MMLADANIHAGYRTSAREGRMAIVWVCVKKQQNGVLHNVLQRTPWFADKLSASASLAQAALADGFDPELDQFPCHVRFFCPAASRITACVVACYLCELVAEYAQLGEVDFFD
jgi:hypothetical protein